MMLFIFIIIFENMTYCYLWVETDAAKIVKKSYQIAKTMLIRLKSRKDRVLVRSKSFVIFVFQ